MMQSKPERVNCSKHDVTMASGSQATVPRVTITATARCEVSLQGAGGTVLYRY